MSIDEISRRKGHRTFATVVGDIDHSVLLEVIDSHRQDEIIEVLALPDLWLKLYRLMHFSFPAFTESLVVPRY